MDATWWKYRRCKLFIWSLTATSRAWGASYFGAAGDVYRSAARYGSN